MRINKAKHEHGWRLLLAVGTIFVSLGADAAYACQCEERQPPCAQYAGADAVFAGRVVLFRTLEDRQYREILFEVKRAFRGVDGNAVELIDHMTSCSYEFEEGKEYLVYAYRESPTRLYTHYCTRTTELSKAADDLTYIKSLSEEKQPHQIVGVLADGDKKLRDVDVVASNDGRQYRTASDRAGWFRLILPQPGRYQVRIYLPLYSDVAGTKEQLDRINKRWLTKTRVVLEYEAVVEPGRCAFINPPLFVDQLEYERHERPTHAPLPHKRTRP